jgi:hypothetical protein
MDNRWRVELLDADGEHRKELAIKGKVRFMGEVDWHTLPE